MMTKYQLVLVGAIASFSISTAFHLPRSPYVLGESRGVKRDRLSVLFPKSTLPLTTAPGCGLAPAAVASSATFEADALPSWRRRPIHKLCGAARRAASALVVPRANSLRASVRRVAISAAVLLAVVCPFHNAFASVGMGGGGASSTAAAAMFNGPLWVPAVLWLSMFVFSATLHAAEISITTLYPWKVMELAEEEGPKSSFAYLNADITRILTTILVLTTSSSVISTVLFTTVVSQLDVSFAKATAFLTFFTLFLGELLPKALGVSNAEMVARFTVPGIAVLSTFFSPIAMASKWAINVILKGFGVQTNDEGKVSEEELRLIVMGARQSGGIEQGEAKMVEGVLDLQDMRVSEVMQPRITMEALEVNATLADFLQLVDTTKYSRVPVYEGEIDRVVGVAIAKDALRFAMQPQLHDTMKVSELMEPTYFVPESMRVQVVLEEMRRRRLHMAIVVDEYGGTSGVVTLEDILEEVVGEIYDEGDSEDETFAEDEILALDDGRFEVRGVADLGDVWLALGIKLPRSDDQSFGTVSGYLCDQAGEIPRNGDVLIVDKYAFTVIEADERRIITVVAEDTSNLVKREACLVANPDNPDVCNIPEDEGAVAGEDGTSGGKGGAGAKLSKATAALASAAAAAFQKESNSGGGSSSVDEGNEKVDASSEEGDIDDKTPPWDGIRP